MVSVSGGQLAPINRFCRQYLQLESHLTYPEGSLLREEAVQEFLYEYLFAPGAASYSPPPRYKLKVLKELVARIEEAIEDWDEHGISDELMTTASHLMSVPLPSEVTAAQQRCYVTYYQSLLPEPGPAASDNSITLLESRTLIAAAGTTGLRTWEPSLHLGQYLCMNPAIARDKQILDLGAGTGYLSVLCAKYLGARHVVASDGSDDVLNNLPDNFFLNGLQGSDKIVPMDLKWGYALVGTEDNEWNGGREIDVILGADVTYDRRIIAPLVATLKELSGLFPKVQTLISTTERNCETFGYFMDVCRSAGFAVERVDLPVPTPEEQTGPFYDHRVPIHICSLTLQQKCKNASGKEEPRRQCSLTRHY